MKICSFFIFLAFILTSCAVTHAPAPIEYNHKNAKISNSGTPILTINDDSTEKTEQLSEVIENTNNRDYALPAPIIQDKKFIYHEVQVGETIEDIALKYAQSIDEIAKLNDLYAPYDMEEFQIIKIKIDKEKPLKRITAKPVPQVPALDYIIPVEGKIISKFGESTAYGPNKGINIAAKKGTKILATAAGKVIYADYDATFGNLVIIKLSGKNIVTSYAHLEDMVLSKGASIKQGDVIGYIGSTGKVKNSQLHFAVREGKNAKDPLKYVKY